MEDRWAYAGDWNESLKNASSIQVAHAGLLLILVRLGLLGLGFEKTALTLGRLGRSSSPSGMPRTDGGAEEVWATNYAISLAAALIPARMLCLERSLVLHHLLRRKGVPAGLRMGVRAFPFEAHAWVEHDGAPVNEVADHIKEFQPIFELD